MLQNPLSNQQLMQLKPGELVTELIGNPLLRHELVDRVALATRNIYQTYKQSFLDSLSPLNQEIYLQALNVPYAPQDWFRDAHDVVVTWSMVNIVHRESLPVWLITAALLHDRGYGILAVQKDQAASSYLQAKGAYWDNYDVRTLHSRLSREFADWLLIDKNSTRLASGISLEAVRKIQGFDLGSDNQLFLEVIEKHDHPLIEKLDELPRIGRHHFDADSLYSISLSSFVKDYLALLSDAAKLQWWSDGGLCKQNQATPERLLEVRMARYFSSEDELPYGWDIKSFPLVPASARFGDGRRCIEPSSETATAMTQDAFELLARCCTEFRHANSVESFTAWFNKQLAAQFAKLENLLP